ncbi:hypothetical protein HCN44_001111 [Aphidius gifuensis]|uniref:Uncharacterized protein n=2 Tax=Aphidius gifuensis TaxID=684658 RepID=A0A834XLL2_APHGI|nr:hypothetical protein HCN44_001111 [Aphidius gifuensis]
MKELEHETLVKRPLKSLLKKPNQNKQRTHKNRVVINEKLNEFFAADYIILIKEECCADYEEECDCCCQETEMIRVGNCKECRAELTRQLASGIDPHYDKNNIINNCIINNNNKKLINGNEESQCEDEGEDEEEEYEEEIDDDYDDDVESSEEHCDNRNCNNIIGNHNQNKSDKLIIVDKNGKKINDNFIIDNKQQQQQQQHHVIVDDDKIHQQQTETLSPPEGYKDVCDDDDEDDDNNDDNDDNNGDDDRQVGNLLREDICTGPVCGECNFYHQQKQQHQQQQQQQQHQQQQQRNSDDKDHVHGQVELEKIEGEEENCQERLDDAIQHRSDQAQQTTPDTHQRYLVETITMTTVTERRIVREISEDEKSHTNSIDEPDTSNNITTALPMIKDNNDTNKLNNDDDEFIITKNETTPSSLKQNINNTNNNSNNNNEDNDNESSSSSSYKKLVNNSLKPNSAVRQLFPDPRFISPPPPPSSLSTKSLSLSTTDDTTTDSDNSDGQKFLITTESLRLFDTVKRTNISGNRSDSSESDTSTIKRTIERNALRRSLICKYDKNNKKINNNNLRGKDLTLEERIRQLTCNIDQDDDIIDSASETQSIDHDDGNIDFPIRTSPSGEEQQQAQQQYTRNDGRIVRQNYNNNNNNDNTLLSSSPVQHLHQHQLHHHHHHHSHNHQHNNSSNINNNNNQSAYRKISDLFGQKKLDNNKLMPDIGLGDLTTTTATTTSTNSSSSTSSLSSTSTSTPASTLMKDFTKSQITKMSNDARKQFLSSLAPLSCVGQTGIDCRDDYYQLTTTTTKKLLNNNELLQCYNSDSSYSLEDIDDVLKIDDKYNKNSCGPPDVTRGTPTGNGPESQDATNDELLAFVEQDKTRTERLKRRYDTDDQQQQQQQQQHDCSILKNYDNNNSNNINNNGNDDNSNNNNNNNDNNINNDDDDDELNDYGFNKRPSVCGIKPKTDENNDIIIRKINSHCTIPSSTTIINEQQIRPLNLTSWQYYEHDSLDKNIQYVDDTNGNICIDKIHDGRDNTIKRINTMQRQIDDIYQTIAETTVSVKAKTMDRCASYHETTSSSSSTLPRNLSRCSIDVQNTIQPQQQQYHDPRNNIRIDTTNIPSTIYNTLPTKNRRQTSGIPLTNNSGYSCGVLPIDNNNQKCYRTMYFVPYSGLSDPTYQNIQKILPPHSSTLPTNYANHIERYPYPRNKNDEQISGQTSARYYTTRQPISANINNQIIQTQQQSQQQQQQQQLQLQQQQLLQLQQQQQQQLQQHLHGHQTEQDYRYSTTPTMQTGIQLQHHQHISQLSTYNLQKMPTYTVMAPSSRTGNYSYSQIHQQGRNIPAVVSATAATVASSSSSSLVGSSVDVSTINSIQYSNGGNFIGNLGNTSLSSSTSSVLNSPTKLRNNNNTCSLERGVPEGAASAPAHDFIVSTNNVVGNTFIGHSNNLPPPNTQNSIYYAMNV